ncbi:DUF3090 domain-containing protein [Nocardioides jiangxiensis]|uniref:DUF3090 domain-containing protein n=1 Tax=Nocardioides jiangxiensis TaxID=3064524 RepID=A0ABT9AX22_9ACTN|nr:DUF3090 domain-containing protein [Nocardioides sp. WY-20]MDO7866857.1 DUF3090 domain-containing protein [Nocardioides sp. WY-20]
MDPVMHSFDPPERFVAGTVGAPGQRTFFLQARAGRRIVSVALEKQQVAVLAQRVDELLDELMQQGGTSGIIPAVAPLDLADDGPLEQPIDEEFRVGTMTLSWDTAEERIVIEVYPLVDAGDESGEPAQEAAGEVLVVRLAAATARAFVARAQKVVGAGRPDCPFCGEPIDASGHLCVRANGFKRRG